MNKEELINYVKDQIHLGIRDALSELSKKGIHVHVEGPLKFTITVDNMEINPDLFENNEEVLKKLSDK
jgi:hypothetical protein